MATRLKWAALAVAVVSVFLLIIVFCVATAGTGAMASGARVKIEQRRQELAAQWAQVQPRFEADEARWVNDPLIAAHDGGNAAQLISSHIRWEYSDAGAVVPAELLASLKPDAGWPHNFDELDVSRVDTAWFSELHTFGFFDIESVGSPVEFAPWRPSYEAIPNFIDLQSLAKVHLTRGLQNGDARPAARDVRDLARVCLTTESLVGEMMGVALLGIERRVYEEALVRAQDVSGWQPFSDEEKKSLQRVLWAAPAPYSLLATGALAEKTPLVGQCAALREATGDAHQARFYAEDVAPERYAALTLALQSAPCRLRRPRVAWANKEPDGQWNCDRGYDPEHICFPAVAMRIPFMKTAFGNVLVSVSTTSRFRGYFE